MSNHIDKQKLHRCIRETKEYSTKLVGLSIRRKELLDQVWACEEEATKTRIAIEERLAKLDEDLGFRIPSAA